jgi:GT2 family glycosyltransferase
MSRHQVSIVVCTFNRAAMLRDALESLRAMKTPAIDSWEIVIIDNGSTDDTRSVCAEYLQIDKPLIRYVYEPRPGISAARNRGVTEAHGEWIAFFDDDQLASETWIDALFRFAAAHSPCCVAGEVGLKCEWEGAIDFPLNRSLSTVLGASRIVLKPEQLVRRRLPGAGNVIVHRKVFERVGKFDETLAEGGEDNDFFRRARQAGFACWLIPNASVEHRIPLERMKFSELQQAAQRMGWYLGRIQAFEEGAVMTLISLGLRTIYHLSTTVPRILAGSLARRTGFIQPISPSRRLRRQDARGEREVLSPPANRRLNQRFSDPLPSAALCELWRFQGYWRSVLHHLFPSFFRGEAFRAEHDFRRAHDIPT